VMGYLGARGGQRIKKTIDFKKKSEGTENLSMGSSEAAKTKGGDTWDHYQRSVNLPALGGKNAKPGLARKRVVGVQGKNKTQLA